MQFNTTKSRQINLNTVIHEVDIDMYIGKGILGHWGFWFFVPTTISHVHYFLDEIIKKILITDTFNSVHEDENT